MVENICFIFIAIYGRASVLLGPSNQTDSGLQ
jgi:hypothetical protein